MAVTLWQQNDVML